MKTSWKVTVVPIEDDDAPEGEPTDTITINYRKRETGTAPPRWVLLLIFTAIIVGIFVVAWPR